MQAGQVDADEREPEREHSPEPVAVEPDRLRHDLADRPALGRQRRGPRTRVPWIAPPGHDGAGYRRAVAYDVVRSAEAGWEAREPLPGQAPRHQASVTDAANLTESRARLWRYPPRSRGRRHLDPDQEEVFVPLRGTLTVLLEDPPQRVDLGPGDVLAVHRGTPMQSRNETDEEVLFFAYGAPPVHGNAVFLDDVEAAPPPA